MQGVRTGAHDERPVSRTLTADAASSPMGNHNMHSSNESAARHALEQGVQPKLRHDGHLTRQRLTKRCSMWFTMLSIALALHHADLQLSAHHCYAHPSAFYKLHLQKRQKGGHGNDVPKAEGQHDTVPMQVDSVVNHSEQRFAKRRLVR